MMSCRILDHQQYHHVGRPDLAKKKSELIQQQNEFKAGQILSFCLAKGPKDPDME